MKKTIAQLMAPIDATDSTGSNRTNFFICQTSQHMIEDHQTELTAAFDENRVAMAPALGTSHGIDLSTVKFQPPQKLRKSLLKRAFSQGFGLSENPMILGASAMRQIYQAAVSISANDHQ